MNEFVKTTDIIMNGKYPRGLGNPARGNPESGYHLAQSAKCIYDFCEANKFTNVYYTTFSFFKYDNPATDGHNAVIDTIPFDFDSKDLQASLDDAKKLVSWCHRHSIDPRVTFSGGKGFHVFLDIIPMKLKNPKRTLSQFCTELSAAAEFTTVDTVIFGDTNRLIRIPNTIHSKSKLYCIPLNSDEFTDLSLDQILELATEQQFDNIKRVNNKNSDVISTLLEIDANMPAEVDLKLIPNKESKLARIFEYKPLGACRAVDMLVAYGTDEGSRDLALTGIIRYYTLLGFTKDEIFSKCLLFDSKCDRPLRRSTIKYKVDYHMKKTYQPCTFLKKIGGVCNGCSKFCQTVNV